MCEWDVPHHFHTTVHNIVENLVQVVEEFLSGEKAYYQAEFTALVISRMISVSSG